MVFCLFRHTCVEAVGLVGVRVCDELGGGGVMNPMAEMHHAAHVPEDSLHELKLTIVQRVREHATPLRGVEEVGHVNVRY